MKAFYLSILMALALLPAHAQRRYNAMRETKKEFFKTEQARLIGDQILDYQRVTGGWPKNIDMAKPMTHEERQQVLNDKSRRDDSTTDNDATNMQMTYLARLYQTTKSKKYREAFCQGVEYLLSGQYDNGGWPQFWPGMRGYQVHITFNDDAMVNTMEMLRDIYLQKAPFDGKLTDKALRQKAIKAFNKGVECILKCQIVKDGKPTIWCQQHDRVTFEPRPARAFELSSYSSNESARIVAMLMEIPNPSEEIKRAIRGAMQWFDTYKLTGLKVVRKGKFGSPFRTTELVKDPDATTPLWARYYDLEHCEPFVCDRDGVPRRHLWEIGTERRNGYSWYSDRTAFIYPLYEKWADKYDTANKLNLSLNSPGANERGLINMNRFSKPEQSCFDAIVNAGERIQDAIEKAPENPAKPFKILIRNGVYHEKVIIDRPNIVLVGEDRDSVIIQYAETTASQTIKEYKGKPVHMGVIVLQDNANDCIISGITVYNNYGSTVEKTTTHQMAIYGKATRTIVINSNIFADGNDALSLWCQNGGMYYHADLYLRCPGVDFMCPRGRCYATRCKFVGNSRAILWHDGRGDINNKFVVTCSSFDALSPTKLGRYHHDHQFYLAHCRMSKNILDSNISYAYSDKVLDPCPWGLRVYYYGCEREGGDSGWLRDNLDQAPGHPAFHGLTALWTFDGKWDPEARIRDLWYVLKYQTK